MMLNFRPGFKYTSGSRTSSKLTPEQERILIIGFSVLGGVTVLYIVVNFAYQYYMTKRQPQNEPTPPQIVLT